MCIYTYIYTHTHTYIHTWGVQGERRGRGVMRCHIRKGWICIKSRWEKYTSWVRFEKAKSGDWRARTRGEVERTSCSTRRSEPVPLEHGCYMSGRPVWEPHPWTLEAEDLSVYIYIHMLIARQQKRGFVIQEWTNTYISTYLHTYIHTYIHTYKILQPTFHYKQTYGLMITNKRLNTYRPTALHSYIYTTLHNSPTLQPLPYLPNPTLPYTYTIPTHVQWKSKNRTWLYLKMRPPWEGWGLLENFIAPPKTCSTGRLPKQQ